MSRTVLNIIGIIFEAYAGGDLYFYMTYKIMIIATITIIFHTIDIRSFFLKFPIGLARFYDACICFHHVG